MPSKASPVAGSSDETRLIKRQRTMITRAQKETESPANKNVVESSAKSDSKALKTVQKAKPKKTKLTKQKETLAEKEVNSPAMDPTSSVSKGDEKARPKQAAQPVRTRLSRKDAALKENLLKKVDVALIVDQITRVYCVPCKEGVDVVEYKKHEAGDEHNAHTFEWKRNCLHFAEKMSYKYLRTDEVYEAGELVESNMIYDPVRQEPEQDFEISSATFAFKLRMDAEFKKLGKKKTLWESLEPQDRLADYTDAVRYGEFVKDFKIETSFVRHDPGPERPSAP